MYRISPIGRKPNLHSREKCLIGLVLATLCLLCFAGIFLLPDNFGGERVLKVYKSFQKAGPEIFIPAPPLAANGHGGGKDTDLHILGDREKLQAKIKEELGDILDKPELQRQGSDEAAAGDPILNENVGMAPVIENDLQAQQQQQQINVAMQQHQVVGALPAPALKGSLNDDGQEMLPVGDMAQLQMPMEGHPDPSPAVQEQRMKVKEVSCFLLSTFLFKRLFIHERKPIQMLFVLQIKSDKDNAGGRDVIFE